MASGEAGAVHVTVVIVGISKRSGRSEKIYSEREEGGSLVTEVANINAYLAPSRNVFVAARNSHISRLETLDRGSAPTDDGAFFFNQSGYEAAVAKVPEAQAVFHRAVGGADFIRGNTRWIVKLKREDLKDEAIAKFAAPIRQKVAEFRAASKKRATQQFAGRPPASLH